MVSTATVNARASARLRGGHPWVYAQELSRAPSGEADVVRVVDGRGALLGSALASPAAPVVLRLFARDEALLDESLLAERLRQALARRQRDFPGADAFRVAHGESDLLPGLFVDRYGDVA